MAEVNHGEHLLAKLPLGDGDLLREGQLARQLTQIPRALLHHRPSFPGIELLRIRVGFFKGLQVFLHQGIHPIFDPRDTSCAVYGDLLKTAGRFEQADLAQHFAFFACCQDGASVVGDLDRGLAHTDLHANRTGTLALLALLGLCNLDRLDRSIAEP